VDEQGDAKADDKYENDPAAEKLKHAFLSSSLSSSDMELARYLVAPVIVDERMLASMGRAKFDWLLDHSDYR
jgi:hypothetical protein